MLTVNLLEPGDWSSGQVPDSVEHISSMDPIMICVFVTTTMTTSIGSSIAYCHYISSRTMSHNSLPHGVTLTGNVPVAIFQSIEVGHELPHGDLENFEQTRILKKGVCHLWRHKPGLLQRHSEHMTTSSMHVNVCSAVLVFVLLT